MHRLTTTFVLGYHGCSPRVAENLLKGNAFRISQNSYDWLGDGVYFWESNPRRGLEFYREAQARRGRPDADAAVVGAIIDLGFCLDLSTSTGIEAVIAAYGQLVQDLGKIGQPLPMNQLGEDRVLRKLDRDVFNYLHAFREEKKLTGFNTARGFFSEGGEAFPGAGFTKKSHVQIAVRTQASIRGVFRVPDLDLAPV